MIHIETSKSYCQEKTYIFHVVLKEFLGIDYTVSFVGEQGTLKITLPNKEEIFFPEILFNTPANHWLTIKCHPKLPLRNRPLKDIQSGILDFKTIPVLYGEESTIEFVSTEKKSNIDLDIFGSIFFLLTLLEEFGRPEEDEFGRFLYTESILYKEKLHHRPIANEYLEIFWCCIKAKCPSLERKTRFFQVKLSHDVDVPLAHTQSTYEFIRSSIADIVLRKSFSTFVKRVVSRLFISKRYIMDPNNNFDYLLNISTTLGLVSEFNFISAEGKGTIDERYEIDSPFFKSLLLTIYKRGHRIGFHPSYFTFDQPEQINFEFKKLKRICEEMGIKQSEWGGRQHYLRWKNPITWRIWNQNQLQFDSSIGSEYFMGFRSGVCYPYSVFDLENKQHLTLVEYPLVVMDIAAFKSGNFKDYHKTITHLSKVCKHYNGVLTVLIHNNYVITKKQKHEYESILKSVI